MMTEPTASRAWRSDDPRRRKQADKRIHMLKVAREVFVSEGFHGTSMQTVADRAGITKMTLYRHFKDKDELFQAMFFEQCLTWREARPLAPAQNLREARSILRSYAGAFFQTITRPDVLLLYRMLIGEISRFPPLGQAFYDYGPKQEIADIERVLARLMPRQEACTRAEAFFYLIMGHTYHQILLGCLAPEAGLPAYKRELGTALRLILAEPTGALAHTTRKQP